MYVQCLQHLDVSVLGELVPRLCELLKSGIGLGTKVDTQFCSHSCFRLSVDALICLLNPPVFLSVGPLSPLCTVRKDTAYQSAFFMLYILFFAAQGGCASVIVSLTVQCPQDLTPYSGKAHVSSPVPVMRLLFGACELMIKMFFVVSR